MLVQQGKLDDAATCFHEALRRQPDDVGVLNNLALVRLQQGRHEEALNRFRDIVRLRPDYAEAHANMGIALHQLGRLDPAIACYERALALKADLQSVRDSLNQARQQCAAAAPRPTELSTRPTQHAELQAHYQAAMAFAQQGKLAEAEAAFRELLKVEPNHIDALHNLGTVLFIKRQWNSAIACFEQVLRQKPDHVQANYNLGVALQEANRLSEAIDRYRQALLLQPSHVDANNNLGNILREQGNLDEALASFERAFASDPNHKGTRFNLAIARLLRGDWERAWLDYELRTVAPGVHLMQLDQPRWDGSPLTGRTVLLFAEQGFGDVLQFVRYAPLVKKRGGGVIVDCHPQLVPLLRSAAGIDYLVGRGDKDPPFELQVPLLSLPGIFRTSLGSIPKAIPYLRAKTELVEYWRQKLAPLGGLKVGIAWQGNPTYRSDHLRSIPLATFAPLAEVHQVHLISLQKGSGARHLSNRTAPFPLVDFGSGLDEASGAFMDTAAIMMNLDLVICSDSAIPHLAGALGVPVWVPVPLVPDWRWLLGREDSPWYPSMRLFRQTSYADWEDVFVRLAGELTGLAAKCTS